MHGPSLNESAIVLYLILTKTTNVSEDSNRILAVKDLADTIVATRRLPRNAPTVRATNHTRHTTCQSRGKRKPAALEIQEGKPQHPQRSSSPLCYDMKSTKTP